MEKNAKIFLVAATIIYFFEGLWMVYMGDIHTDESWWFYGSILTANGYFPHYDFAIHHNGLFYFIYAIPQYLFGSDIIVGRLTSIFLSVLIFYMTMRLSYREGGIRSLYITGLLFIINLFAIYRYSVMHYQVLQTFFLISLVSVFYCNVNKNVKVISLVLLSICIISVRYPIDYFSILFLSSIIIFIYMNKKDKVAILIIGLTSLVGLAIAIGPYLLFIPEKYYFNTIWYMLFMQSFKADFGLTDDITLITTIITRLEWIKMTVTNFFPTLLIFVTVVLTRLYVQLTKKKFDNNYMRFFDYRYSILTGFIIITLIFYIIPNDSDLPAHTNFIFPIMVFIASVGLTEILENIDKKSFFSILTFISTTIVFGLCLLIPVGVHNNFSFNYTRSDIKNVMTVANEIEKSTDLDDLILSFSPIFVGQANRRVIKGMEMEYASFFPTYNTEKALKYNLMNLELLRENIINKIPAAIVLTENRFFIDLGYSNIIKSYRQEILSLIEENYHIEKIIENPRSIYRGDTYIYLPL